MTKNRKLEFTCIGKYVQPKLQSRILLEGEGSSKSYHVKCSVTAPCSSCGMEYAIKQEVVAAWSFGVDRKARRKRSCLSSTDRTWVNSYKPRMYAVEALLGMR